MSTINKTTDGATTFATHDSSVIARTAYAANAKTLGVKFNNGSAYLYFDVPQTIYEVLCDAESTGKYFNTAIRDCYKFMKLAA